MAFGVVASPGSWVSGDFNTDRFLVVHRGSPSWHSEKSTSYPGNSGNQTSIALENPLFVFTELGEDSRENHWTSSWNGPETSSLFHSKVSKHIRNCSMIFKSSWGKQTCYPRPGCEFINVTKALKILGKYHGKTLKILQCGSLIIIIPLKWP